MTDIQRRIHVVNQENEQWCNDRLATADELLWVDWREQADMHAFKPTWIDVLWFCAIAIVASVAACAVVISAAKAW